MIKLYHLPVSFNSRRIWIALLEKALPFELVEMRLDGDQFQPDYLALNPFHHIPVLVDGGLRVLESLAILDYLEAKYPSPPLLPTDPAQVATVRMVELVTINELVPPYGLLVRHLMGANIEDAAAHQARQRIGTVLAFFEQLLGEKAYFAGEQLTLAEVVAGTIVPRVPGVGVLLDEYPRLQQWSRRLAGRPSWQQSEPKAADLAASRARMAAMAWRSQP
ncbi:glutathione S-transferase family protein [Gloeobacter kilaueensis]|uniref:Glutathione S-transferase n=1 Tax=Gloeobacter kilaueensis (strain ATCC BAA-2537 / CCAP 1431/1 / ULC 316 / JS1) TaxID=1183438 RepID=U5QED5_GLOK1|nr:glutathione S-transferase family protein [Gloeobacter kilaueensis]AGY57238.1 glutathione S-transferase [Gloeobacter kilaueensis JS1]